MLETAADWPIKFVPLPKTRTHVDLEKGGAAWFGRYAGVSGVFGSPGKIVNYYLKKK
jgi:hypothetical protein